MKKTISFILAALMLVSIAPCAVSAETGQNTVNAYSTGNWLRFTYNYEFSSGVEVNSVFGKPTSTDVATRNPESENIRCNKDTALLPPSFGVFSGEIPTSASSLYHSNVRPDYATNVTNYSMTSETGALASTSFMQSAASAVIEEIIISQSSVYGGQPQTQAILYEDGNLGTLKIPKLGLSVKVYEGETLENMSRGIGHFEFTSAWNGNIGLAGHNRGSSAYFANVWNLEYGDEIIFTTKYGQRVYTVYSKQKISDTDYSKLGWSGKNIITMITCSANEDNLRWCIQASEKTAR